MYAAKAAASLICTITYVAATDSISGVRLSGVAEYSKYARGGVNSSRPTNAASHRFAQVPTARGFHGWMTTSDRIEMAATRVAPAAAGAIVGIRPVAATTSDQAASAAIVATTTV